MSECMLRTLACRGLRVGPSKEKTKEKKDRALASITPRGVRGHDRVPPRLLELCGLLD